VRKRLHQKGLGIWQTALLLDNNHNMERESRIRAACPYRNQNGILNPTKINQQNKGNHSSEIHKMVKVALVNCMSLT